MKKRSTFLVSMLAFGYAFLYIPLILVIVYSFNDSRIATVWGGFSTRWYRELLQNDLILNAAFLSLRIALTSATFATILGTMAGLVLARFGRFKGRTLFSGMITSPMVMPTSRWRKRRWTWVAGLCASSSILHCRSLRPR
jgi:putrescine transport system permease protein